MHKGGMISKKNSGRLLGVCFAATYGILITAGVYGLWPGMHIALILLLFIGLSVGFYFAGIWATVERPAELDRKFPISSKEVRRRKKEFHDWLNSLGRR